MSPTANLVYYGVVTTVLLTAVFALASRPRRGLAIRVIAFAGFVFALGWTWASWQVPYDFKRFWWVGHDLGAGRDYYAIAPGGERDLILNPPTALPLFRLWSLLPMRSAARLWTLLNAVGILALVPLAQAALRAQIGPDAPRLPRHSLSILTAAASLSCSQGMGLALGQVALLTALGLLAALWARGRGRPLLAGVCLAVATIKVNTLLPFLLLFLRKRDRLTWLSLGVVTLGLCLATGGADELPRRCLRTIAVIQSTFEPGQVNDYAFEGPSHAGLVGIDHALYRLGFTDRALIRRLQIGVLAALVGVVAFQVRRERWSDGLACSLVAAVAAVFFYHRLYDLLILSLPLVHAALASVAGPSAGRSKARAAAILLLLVWFVNPEGLEAIETASMNHGAVGFVVRAITGPLALWLIGLAVAVLGFGVGRDGRRQAHPGAPFSQRVGLDAYSGADAVLLAPRGGDRRVERGAFSGRGQRGALEVGAAWRRGRGPSQ